MAETLFLLCLDLVAKIVDIFVKDIFFNKLLAPFLIIEFNPDLLQLAQSMDHSLVLDMVGHIVLLLLFDLVIALLDLSTYQLEVIILNGSFLLFKPVDKHIVAIESDFDVMSNLHDATKVGWVSQFININTRTCEVTMLGAPWYDMTWDLVLLLLE